MNQDVVITGMGVITPYGNDVQTFYDALAAGKVAIRPTPWMPPEAGVYSSAIEGFVPEDWMSPKVAEGTDRFAQYALACTKLALRSANLSQLDPLRTAIVFGTSMGGAGALQRAQSLLERQGPDAVPRKLQIQVWPNMAAAQVAMEYDLHGPSLTVCTACASSLDAIGTATRFIQGGLADVAITGGTEGSNSDVDYLPALSANQLTYGMVSPSTDPLKACRPFDRDRSGIAGGAGSAVFVLESRTHAQARGATPLGVVCGYASLADGYHPSSPEPSGRWEALVMRRALEDASLDNGAEVAAIYAHGTGTRAGDAAEIRAINDVYGYRGRDLLVTSLKGHFRPPRGIGSCPQPGGRAGWDGSRRGTSHGLDHQSGP